MAEVIKITEDDGSPKEKTPIGWNRFWSKEKEASDKRLSKFIKQGNTVVARFLDERTGEYALRDGNNTIPSRLNLFWRNITTQQNMLYGNTPTIDVSREHHDPDDDIARVACLLYQRILQSDVESSGEDLPTALKAALQDRLLPGLGFCRVRYTMSTTQQVVTNPLTGATEETEQLEYENAPADYVNWQDFRWGWARTWSEVPWLGFRSWLDKEESTKRFGEKIAANLEYKNQLPTGDEKNAEGIFSDSDQKNNVQKAEIWEFWCKKTKKVYWWSQGCDVILDMKDDPLGLDGFWPGPRPMMANLTTSNLIPTADYIFSQDLYAEIDVLQSRISTITRAIKVIGVYDKNSSDSVGRMLQEGTENQLIPVDNWAMFGEKGGLQGVIQWFPVQEVVQTLEVLQGIQQRTIQQLYEITGMSDLLRGGDTDQYTSDGTNKLKAKFGSINIQALQDDFARFASDLEALKAEVISKHYSPQSIVGQSNAAYLPEVDRPKVPAALELMQSPDIKWRVNIRPESIAMIDYAQLKSERTEYLTAIATYLQSATSMATAVPESLPLLLEFMKFGMVGFKGSNYMEGILDQAIDLAKKMPPKQDEKGQEQQQLIQMQIQGELQKIQAKTQADLQTTQAKSQAELMKVQMDNQANLAEIQAKGQADLTKIVEDLKADLTVIRAKLDGDLAREEAQSTFAVAEEEVRHADSLTEMAVDHEYQMDQIEEVNERTEGDD